MISEIQNASDADGEIFDRKRFLQEVDPFVAAAVMHYGVAGVFLPRQHRHVPVEVLRREAVVDALVGLFDAAEEALDHVRVRAVIRLVLQAMVHTDQLDEAIWSSYASCSSAIRRA